jgi:hypothetical protein
MDYYVLYVGGFALFAAGYAAIWSLGGPVARTVLSLGAYQLRPRPKNRFRRGHADHRARRDDFEVATLLDLPAPRDYWHQTEKAHVESVPVVTGTGETTMVMPHLVHAVQETDQYGAEHWGSLLQDMTTEERTIFSAELVATYEQTKDVERPFLDSLDAAVERFMRDLDRLERREAAAFEGVMHNVLNAHGGRDRWSTGQYPILQTAT